MPKKTPTSATVDTEGTCASRARRRLRSFTQRLSLRWSRPPLPRIKKVAAEARKAKAKR